MDNPKTVETDKSRLERTVGAAVKTHRQIARLTLAELSARAGVSTAMISKIERGQVSASLGTLEALAKGIGVPLINFFAETVEISDVSFVAAGEGVSVQRLGRGFGHTYKLIGRADSGAASFESFSVTLEAPLEVRPIYIHQGVEFMHVTDGEMVYRCGENSYPMRPGDTLSFDCSIPHGPVEIVTPTVTFISVIAKGAGDFDIAQ